MKKTDPALYVHIYTEKGDWENATPVWVLAIGKTVPGLVSHGAPMRVGLCNTAEEAVAVAIERGVAPERVDVGE